MDPPHEPPPPGEQPQDLPKGPVRYALFGGILEGRVADEDALEAIASQMNRLDTVPADLEIDGGRFTLLLDDGPVPGARVSPAKQAQLLGLLEELIQASARPHEVESTLHVTHVYADAAVETLLAIVDGELQPVSRVRDLKPGDTLREEGPESLGAPLRALGVKRGLLVGALLLVVFGLMAWRSGYVDMLFHASVSKLAIERGPFAGILAVSASERWGSYIVTISRGPAYPKDAADVARLRRERTDLPGQAAVRIAAEGGRLFVQLRDGAGRVLQSEAAELGALLSDAEAEVSVRISGRLKAQAVRLSLGRGLARESKR